MAPNHTHISSLISLIILYFLIQTCISYKRNYPLVFAETILAPTPWFWPISYMYYDPSFHLFYLLTLAFMCKSWPLRFEFGTPSWLPLFWTFAGNLVAIVMLINSGLQPRQA